MSIALHGKVTAMALHEIKKPYLLLIGDMANPAYAKTAFGLRDWAPQDCTGQLRFNPSAVDLGLSELSIEEAVARGAKTLVVGIAPVGGGLARELVSHLAESTRGRVGSGGRPTPTPG